jgi:hypothetical protein
MGNGPEIWDAIGVEKGCHYESGGPWLPLVNHVGSEKVFYTIKRSYLFHNIPTKTQTKFLDKIHSLF